MTTKQVLVRVAGSLSLAIGIFGFGLSGLGKVGISPNEALLWLVLSGLCIFLGVAGFLYHDPKSI